MATALVALGSWLLGCAFYTSLGVDTDWLAEGGVHTRYYRVRWPGDGSLWLGGGSFVHPAGEGAVEPLDLAAIWLQPARPATPGSVWNRLGFWWVWKEEEGWLGVPGWLAPLALSVPFLRNWWCRRQQ